MELEPQMEQALRVAEQAIRFGDMPVGVTIVEENGSVLVSAHNEVELSRDPTSHAEMVALRRLIGTRGVRIMSALTLFSTLEPCPMCAWAIRSVRLGRVVFGADNPSYGAAGSAFDLLRDGRHGSRIEVVGGVLAAQCSLMLKDFFAELR